MSNLIREKWFKEESKLKYSLREYNNVQKKKNEKMMDDFLYKVNEYVGRKPKDKKYEKVWEKEGEDIFTSFLREDNLFNLKYVHEEIRDSIKDVLKKFINEAKKFDRSISNSYIFQGLRNVLIITLLQVMFNSRVEFTKSIFAYSMIYPYSDNFLDSDARTMEEKNKFNDRLSLMIKGSKIKNKTSVEEKIYKLIKYIEEDYNREDFPKVYESLLRIQEGQIKSINQQEKSSVPYKTDILGISIEKGGASVLADGYLIKGNLSSREEEFCLVYGFMLQLVDDFQDVKEDKSSNHATIMSQLAGKYYLDEIINKLINFVHEIFYNSQFLKDKVDLQRVMKSNCVILILYSIALNKEYFSGEYIKEMNKYFPFTIKYMKKLGEKLGDKIKEKEVLV